MNISHNKFICSAPHAFINMFHPYLNIEYTNDKEVLKKSDKIYINWNWYTNFDVFSYRKTHNLPFLCVERGALPKSIFFDKNGFNFNSSSYQEKNWDKKLKPEQLYRINSYIEDFKDFNKKSIDLEHQLNQNISKESILKDIDVNKFKKIVFIPFQISSDTVIKHFSGFCGNFKNFINYILDYSQKHKDILFIYKNHPLEKNLNINSDNLFCADNYHFKACLDLCDSVVAINSGVGLQSMLYYKPVILFGDAFYNFKDINYKVNKENEISDLLNSDLIVDKEKIKRFLSWLNFDFYSEVEWINIKHENSSILKEVNRFNIWTEEKTFRYK